MIRKIIFITYLLLFMLVCLWINQLIHGDMPYIDQWSRKFVSQIADTPLYIFLVGLPNLGEESFSFLLQLRCHSFYFLCIKVCCPRFFSVSVRTVDIC